MSVSPANIRRLFLERQPSYSAAEAADLFAMTERELLGWMEAGELEGEQTNDGLRLPWPELVSSKSSRSNTWRHVSRKRSAVFLGGSCSTSSPHTRSGFRATSTALPTRWRGRAAANAVIDPIQGHVNPTGRDVDLIPGWDRCDCRSHECDPGTQESDPPSRESHPGIGSMRSRIA